MFCGFVKSIPVALQAFGIVELNRRSMKASVLELITLKAFSIAGTY